MKKSTLALLTALLLLAAVGLTACGKKTEGESTTAFNAATEQTTAAADESVPAGETAAQDVTATAVAPDQQETAAPAGPESGTEAAGDPAGEDAAPAGNGTAIATSASKHGAVIRVEADKTGALRTGDSVTLNFRISGAKLLACMDIELAYDARYFEVESCLTDRKNGLESMAQNENGLVTYAGYVMKTADVDEGGLFSVKLKVKDGANASVSVFEAAVTQYLVGTDASGDKTNDVTAEFPSMEFTLAKAG